MRTLVRTITRKGKGATAHSDKTVDADVLSIGRAADSAIFLSDIRVALNHAKLTPAAGRRFRLESLIGSGVRVNGSLEQAKVVSRGDTIEIGSQRITLAKPPPDFDLMVEVEEVEKISPLVGMKRPESPEHLAHTWLSKRRPSWLLFVLILLVGLAVPLFGFYAPGVGKELRDTPLVPSDGLWEAGTLASPHHYFGENCNQCHTRAFKRVRDSSCLTCHSDTPAHADPDFFQLPELVETRCASCHEDHNGLRALVNHDDALCSDCHADLREETRGRTPLGNAADFHDNHPQFQVLLANWNDNGEFEPERVSLDQENLVEGSNLKFPHDVHLDADGIESPDGKRTLDCGSCHLAEAGGARMQPVDFETMCQDCHRLTFDVQAPDREVPHGELSEIMFMLNEFYARRAIDTEYQQTAESTTDEVRVRRRPAGPRARRQGMSVAPANTSATALKAARGKALQVAERLFTAQACHTCHQVAPTRGDDGVLGTDDDFWQIEPVRVAGAWYGKSDFTHAKHRTMECKDCHDARQSTTSNDVLIPGIANCRQCHGGPHTEGKLNSSCVDCHNFHISDEIQMTGVPDLLPDSPAQENEQDEPVAAAVTSTGKSDAAAP